jgi:hypothetical protein
MMHKFICETADSHKQYTAVENIEFVLHEDASLDEMCDAFTSYLKAVGYQIKDGHVVDIVPMDGYNDPSWEPFFKGEGVTDDFNPRASIDDATPAEWNRVNEKNFK